MFHALANIAGNCLLKFIHGNMFTEIYSWKHLLGKNGDTDHVKMKQREKSIEFHIRVLICVRKIMVYKI